MIETRGGAAAEAPPADIPQAPPISTSTLSARVVRSRQSSGSRTATIPEVPGKPGKPEKPGARLVVKLSKEFGIAKPLPPPGGSCERDGAKTNIAEGRCTSSVLLI